MGEDVVAVGTVCNGDKQLIEEGKQFGTTLQSPLHEGQLAIKMVEEYLDTGELANYINFHAEPGGHPRQSRDGGFARLRWKTLRHRRTLLRRLGKLSRHRQDMPGPPLRGPRYTHFDDPLSMNGVL